MSISIQFPIEVGPNGFLSYTDDQTSEAIDQNLKFLLLTRPGTFFEEPEFGVGIQKFIFEFGTNQTLEDVKSLILRQARTYLPYLTLLDVAVTFDEFVMNIRIEYRIDQTNRTQYFELTTEAS
mgnify:FL=1|jgi:phage baseplate assembly protein W